jgi:hypothetical protein
MVYDQITAFAIAGVTNALNGVMLAMDEGDDEKFASFFVPEAKLTISISGAVKQGREEIGAIASGVKAKFPTAQHYESNIFVSKPHFDDVELDHVKNAVKKLLDEHQHLSKVPLVCSKSYWKALDGGDVIAQGEHHDILVQWEKEGPWLIVTRVIQHTWTKQAGFLEPK